MCVCVCVEENRRIWPSFFKETVAVSISFGPFVFFDFIGPFFVMYLQIVVGFFRWHRLFRAPKPQLGTPCARLFCTNRSFKPYNKFCHIGIFCSAYLNMLIKMLGFRWDIFIFIEKTSLILFISPSRHLFV